MTWIKVCGVGHERDVAAAAAAGADAVGFVLAASPRRVTVDTARRLGKGAPLLTVIVTVDLTPEDLMAAVVATGAGGVQPHGAHQAVAARRARREGLFVLHPRAVHGMVDVTDIPADEIPLLDAYRSGVHGGTGRGFDWGLIGDPGRRFVLAGGLDPDNVGDALRQTAAWGVDASSGLESSPGLKDPDKIRLFVERARAS